MEFIEHLEVVSFFADRLIGISPNLLGPDIFQDGFGLLRVVPEVRLMRNTFFVFDFYSLAIVVKDTSSRQPRGPSRLSIGLWSLVEIKSRKDREWKWDRCWMLDTGC
jgi:hypothetical protein